MWTCRAMHRCYSLSKLQDGEDGKFRVANVILIATVAWRGLSL